MATVLGVILFFGVVATPIIIPALAPVIAANSGTLAAVALAV